MPEENVNVQVDVEPAAEANEPAAGVEAAAEHAATTDAINHDRITRLEERMDELNDRLAVLDNVVTLEMLEAREVPPHDHPELAARIDALEVEDIEDEDVTVIEPPPAPEPAQTEEQIAEEHGPKRLGWKWL